MKMSDVLLNLVKIMIIFFGELISSSWLPYGLGDCKTGAAMWKKTFIVVTFLTFRSVPSNLYYLHLFCLNISLKHRFQVQHIKPLFSAISLNLPSHSLISLFLTFLPPNCSVIGWIGVLTSTVSTPLLLTVYSDMSNDSISSYLIAIRSLHTKVGG